MARWSRDDGSGRREPWHHDASAFWHEDECAARRSDPAADQSRRACFVDLSGVSKRYHVNMARTFSVGEPEAEAKRIAERAAASMEIIRGMLRPNLPVREFNETVKAFLTQEQLWERRGLDRGAMKWALRFRRIGSATSSMIRCRKSMPSVWFEPGTAVNYENQFFLPRHAGQYFTIDTFLFQDTEALNDDDAAFRVDRGGVNTQGHNRRTDRYRDSAVDAALTDKGPNEPTAADGPEECTMGRFEQLLNTLDEYQTLDDHNCLTLPPDAYFCPQLYEIEVEQIFKKEWLCVGREDKFPQPETTTPSMSCANQ